jgi:hypothetical protein
LLVEWTGLIKCRGGTSPVRRRVLSTINVEDARPRSLTSSSAHWLTSRAVGHAAASGLRLSGERKRTRYGPDTCRPRTPPDLDQCLGILCPGIPGPYCEWPGPCTGGSGTRPRGPSTPVEVLDLTRRSGPYVQGSGTFPWGPDLLLISWSISSSLATWRPGSRPCGGVGRYFTT